jgi:holo-[acyl-carrier protein] synthase
MIYGIGTDIVRIARMRKNLERFGERFARRILADVELEEFRQHARPAHFLAKRFAAKEAVAKAMGTGFRDGFTLRHLSVHHDARGKPFLEFHEAALVLLRENRITSVHLSVADEDEYAIAFVTLGT